MTPPTDEARAGEPRLDQTVIDFLRMVVQASRHTAPTLTAQSLEWLAEREAADLPKGPAVIVVFGNGTTSIGHKFAVWWDDQFGTRAVSAFGDEFEKFVEETEDMEIPAEDDQEGWEK